MKKALVWLRRDLRLHDHAALHHALKECDEIHLVFIFDQTILAKLPRDDRRVTFIHESLQEMEHLLNQYDHSLIIQIGDPKKIIPELMEEMGKTDLYFNRDYEPSTKERDEFVTKALARKKQSVHTYKDHVFFEKHEVLTKERNIYKVFTPYKNQWLKVFVEQDKIISDYDCPLKKLSPFDNPESILHFDYLKELGFIPQDNYLKGGTKAALSRLENFEPKIKSYHADRDYPWMEGTSLLSTYLRFGNLSLRDMIRAAVEAKGLENNVWLSEIIWRDFYQMILDTHPYVTKSAFKKEYDQIQWPGTEEQFQAWCNGMTGFPIVDAAMRCLNQTGIMHNRLRMIVASFLCKTLLVDWRKGEKYFAQKLLDFDLAANNGGWQWCSSTGCDSQPYFRIFNPYSQSEKFDYETKFIKQFCPELKFISSAEIHSEMTKRIGDYPQTIVSYKQKREDALSLYSAVKTL